MPNLNEKEWQALRQRKQCWECKHNRVWDYCNDCLMDTVVFERTGGTVGKFKPGFEEGLHCMRLPYQHTYDKKTGWIVDNN